jgi:hypothetical protein
VDKAEEWLLRALAIKERTLGKDHPDVSRVLVRLGGLYIERVEYDKAENFYKRVNMKIFIFSEI